MGKVSVYKSIVNDDLHFLSSYRPYIEEFENVMNRIDYLKVNVSDKSPNISNDKVNILNVCKNFYLSLSKPYNNLYTRFASDKKNTIEFIRLKNNYETYGLTTPIGHTGNAFLEIGYQHKYEDYVTAIHEFGHGISNMLNSRQFDDIEKYCLTEVDGIFFEMLSIDYLSSIFDKKEFVRLFLSLLKDYLIDFSLIDKKVYMYKNATFKWTKTNLEEYAKSLGYSGNYINKYIDYKVYDLFQYAYSYILASELYLIYRQDNKSAFDLLINIIKKRNCNAEDYLKYVHYLGINPGDNFFKYLDVLIDKDKEVGNGKRLQYTIK